MLTPYDQLPEAWRAAISQVINVSKLSASDRPPWPEDGDEQEARDALAAMILPVLEDQARLDWWERQKRWRYLSNGHADAPGWTVHDGQNVIIGMGSGPREATDSARAAEQPEVPMRNMTAEELTEFEALKETQTKPLNKPLKKLPARGSREEER